MVLAELVASGELVSADELRPGDGIALLPLRLDGITLCPGLARGVAVLHQPDLAAAAAGRRGSASARPSAWPPR